MSQTIENELDILNIGMLLTGSEKRKRAFNDGFQ
jgi:hypothetical protein